MLIIRCSRCRRKLFKYLKVGTGKVLYCHKDRMSQDDLVVEGNRVICQCGNLIGIDEGTRIKMRQDGFDHTGRKLKR